MGWLPLTLTVVLHLLFLILISLSWKSMVVAKPVNMPGHINVTIMKASDLVDKKKEHEAEIQKKKLEQARLLKKKQEALKRIARIKAKKKAEEIKREQVLKQKQAAALALKKAEEQKKLEEMRKQKEQEKKQALAKQKALEKQQEAEKQAELAKKKQDALLKEVMEKALKEQAQREAELKHQAELAKQKEQARLAQIAANQKAKEDMTEVAKYTARIKVMITQRWHIPISARPDMKVILKIRLLPTGELNAVSVSQSSGNDAFDNSAMSAVQSIAVYPVPEDNVLFENNFRQFFMSFSPQDQQSQ